jgi:drug/metabolite transporter (DMT)-like permease
MVGACAIWGLGPIWIRLLLFWLSPAAICFWRVLIGGLVLLPCLAWCSAADRRRLVALGSTWLGGFFLFANMLCYAAATRYLSPAEVNLLFQVCVVSNALLGLWLYHESVPRRRWLALATVLAGAALVIVSGDGGAARAGGGRWLGVALGLGAGLNSSAIQAAIRDTAHRGLALPAMLMMGLIGAVLFCAAAGGRVQWVHPPEAVFWRSLLLLGLLGSGVANLLVGYALPRISLAQAGITTTTQPVVTILVTTLLLGERLPPLALVGSALVVGGVAWSALLEDQVRHLRPAVDHPPTGAD